MEKTHFEKAKKEGIHILKELKTLAIRMVKSPVTTFLEEIQRPQIKMAITLIVTYGLILAFIALQSVYKINQMASGFMFGESSIGFGTYLKAFITPIFIVGFQAALITALVISVALIFKKPFKKESIFSMVGLTYMPAILFSLIGVVISVIFPSVGMLLGTFGLLMVFLLLSLGVKEVLNLEADRAIYVVPGIVVTLFLISGFLMKTSLMNSAGGMMNFLF